MTRPPRSQMSFDLAVAYSPMAAISKPRFLVDLCRVFRGLEPSMVREEDSSVPTQSAVKEVGFELRAA